MKPLFSDISGRRALRSMWSLAVALGLFLSLTLPASAAATATDTVDQAQLLGWPWNYQHLDVMAQTFTAGKTAPLDKVSLMSDAGSANITVEIYSVVPGTPSTPGARISSTTKFAGSLVCCQQFHDFTFDPAVPVTAGTQYAIVVNVIGGDLKWYTSGAADYYPGGQLFVACAGCDWLTGSTTYGADFAFKTWVMASAPAASGPVISGAPTSSPEGTAISLTGSMSGTAAPTNAYTWTVTKDGAKWGNGATGSTFTFTPDDEGTFVVTLQSGTTSTKSAPINVMNVPPTAKITGFSGSSALVLTTQEDVNFSGTFSDPGTADSHTAIWTFGDGVTSSTTTIAAGGPTTLSATHSYSAAGTYTVKLTVTDEDGAVGGATTQVIVQTVTQALSSIAAAVQNLSGLNEGQKNSLIVKLNAASAAIARGDRTAANNQLNAFLNELQADLNAGRISIADATTLRGAVNAIKAALGTYNRFLSWWPLSA